MQLLLQFHQVFGTYHYERRDTPRSIQDQCNFVNGSPALCKAVTLLPGGVFVVQALRPEFCANRGTSHKIDTKSSHLDLGPRAGCRFPHAQTGPDGAAYLAPSRRLSALQPPYGCEFFCNRGSSPAGGEGRGAPRGVRKPPALFCRIELQYQRA